MVRHKIRFDIHMGSPLPKVREVVKIADQDTIISMRDAISVGFMPYRYSSYREPSIWYVCYMVYGNR